MSDDRYDDGLVHSHGWLTEPLAHLQPQQQQQQQAQAGAGGADEASFDDGLVHSHGWACSERGRPVSTK